MSAGDEIDAGERFEFGENWARFLELVDERRIADAQTSLAGMLQVDSMDARSFLDIGCGSGLFSLAARRLGARVHSFDFDAQSVACARELKRRYAPDDADWTIEEGSVLDAAYTRALGEFDIVYSWGVLHHTGAMWLAIERAIGRVRPGGLLFIAIYADQGWKSRVWWLVKCAYNALPRWLRPVYAGLVSLSSRLLLVLKYTLKGRPMTALAPLFRDDRARGMSARRDELDWIGGFPYEYASLETLVAYLGARGFAIEKTRPAGSLGCHEIVARRG